MAAKVKPMERSEGGAPEAGIVDPRASVHPGAEIGPNCAIGPFAVIGPGVRLGAGCTVYGHAVLEGPTVLGPENIVHPFACIGGPPQDLRYAGEPTELLVGRGNRFREHVTVNRGTPHGGGVTTIGDHNLFMAYCHVAHDCRVGSHVVMANHATVAGHVAIEDYAVFGGLAAVGAFLRVGESAMVAAGSMVEREAPPFCIVAGDRARLRAVNRVGLGRRGFGMAARGEIKAIFKALKQPGLPLGRIVEEFEAQGGLTDEARRMLGFLRAVKHGLVR